MPRHRIEREPRHRAQRPTRERAPRVQFRAATAQPTGHRRPATGPARFTIRWQGIGTGASDRIVALRTRMRPYRRRLVRGAVRGLVVSPWFAAGAGFVVAAGAFMYAPHAQLSPGNPLIGRTPCKAHGCKSTTEQGAKPLNAAAGQLPASPSPSPSTPPTTGLTFKYAVSWHTHDTFEMVLIVAGKKAIGDWRLTFTIQGATKITSVLGADWQPSGTGGVVATGATYGGSQDASVPSSGSPSARPTSGDDNYSDAGARSPDVIYLVVDGSGTPKAPDDCFFDGSACQFAQMTSP